MKVVMRDNFDEFMKNFISKTQLVDEKIKEGVRQALDEMCKEMIKEIQSKRSSWAVNGTELVNVDGEDVKYELTENGGTIYVGRDTDKIEMEDGATVNPYLFIEFGWGIEGEHKPVKYAYQHGWEYNINEHKKGWAFFGIDNKYHSTRGRTGIDFFYGVIKKYRPKFKQIIKEALLRD